MEITAATKQEILERMRSAPMLDKITPRLKGCIYGPNGVGKTTLAVGMLRRILGPEPLIVFVDTNEGYLSLRNHEGLTKNVLPIPYESVEQLYVIAESVYRNIPPFVNVGGIIFDDADFMASAELNKLWHSRVKAGGSKSDPEKPARPEYLKLGFRFMEVLNFIFQQTPQVHLILTAHDGQIKNKEGDTVLKVIPGFNPALAKDIAGVMQFVVSMTAKVANRDTAEYIREIQVHPTAIVDCKTRIGCDKLKYEAIEFTRHVHNWLKAGAKEDDEKTAIRREIETSRLTTEDDEIHFQSTSVEEDDAPTLVE